MITIINDPDLVKWIACLSLYANYKKKTCILFNKLVSMHLVC